MMVNTLQLVYYSAIMSLYFPKILITLFSFLGVANLENALFSEIYLKHFDSSKVEDRKSWDYRFENQNVETTNVLINCSDMFMNVILLIIYYIWVLFLDKIWRKKKLKSGLNEDDNRRKTYSQDEQIKKKSGICRKIKLKISNRIESIHSRFFFNSIFRIAFEMFLDVGFASSYNLYNMKWENEIDIYSNLVSLVWIIIFSLILISIPYLYWSSSKLNKESGKFQVLFEDFKTSK